jgi:hypothetical protein
VYPVEVNQHVTRFEVRLRANTTVAAAAFKASYFGHKRSAGRVPIADATNQIHYGTAFMTPTRMRNDVVELIGVTLAPPCIDEARARAPLGWNGDIGAAMASTFRF